MKTPSIRTGSHYVLLLLSAALLPLRAAALDAPALSDPQAIMRTATNITAAAYPNADDVVVYEHLHVTYEADGTAEQRDDEYVKVLTEKGKRDHQTLALHFCQSYETAQVSRVDILKPDGTAVPVDVARQSRVMVDSGQMAMNIYDPNQKILNVSVPGLEVGDTLHAVSRRTTFKPRVPGTWSDYSVFEHTTPIRHIVYEVSGPTNRPLQRITLRDPVTNTVQVTRTDANGRLGYRWEIRDVPRMFPEPSMPPLHTVVQRLLVSTTADWPAISRWYWNLCQPRLAADSPELKQKVAELTAGLADPAQKTEKLFRFVSQQIRYMGITTETEAPGYEPHEVKVTFQNRYGVCRDKAALLVAMLRLADLPAFPVLITVGAKMDPEVPVPWFNHAVVGLARPDGSYQLMDPTDENTPVLCPAYLNNRSFLVATPEGAPLRVSPIDPATNNLVRIRSSGRIDDTGALRMTAALRFEGMNDNAYRGYLARQRPDDRRRVFERGLKENLSGATLTAFELRPADLQDVSQPLTVDLAYAVPDYPARGADCALLRPPWLGRFVGYANWVIGETGLERRRYPFETEIACGIVETFDIDVGRAVGPALETPAAQAVDTGKLSFRQDFTAASNRLQGAAQFLINAVDFAPAEYLALKQALKDIEYERRKQPVFAAAADAVAPDVAILADHTVVALADAQHWTTTQTVRKRVLTYAGKKQNAELKLAFNAAWSEVTLDAATVTSPDGTVHRVAASEQNVMDAPWVASAPRYPAEKTLVVSLPGVEVGSVIAFKVTRTSRGVPFWSLVRSFRGLDPVEAATFEVTAPRALTLRRVDRTGGGIAFGETADGDRVRYTWTAPRQAAVKPEDALPPWWSFNPSVLLSVGTWPAYLADVRAALEPAAARQPEARALAKKLVGSVRGDAARVAAIRDHVAQVIRPAGPGLNALPLAAVTLADRTLKEGYGNTTDRAVLLFALLKAAGLQPEFVLAAAGGPRLEALRQPLLDCPQRDLFDNVLVRVKLNGAWVYLNDTDQYAWLGATAHDGRPGLTLDGRAVTIEAARGMEDRVEAAFKVALAADGSATVQALRRYRGAAFGSFHRTYAELPPEERRRHFLELVAELSQSAVAEGDLRTDYAAYPGERAFTARIARYGVRSGKFLCVTLPDDGVEPLPLSAEQRTHPLFRDAPLRSVTTYDIALPAGTRAVHVTPPDLDWSGPAGMGTVRFTTEQQTDSAGARTLRITRTVDLQSAVVPADRYAALLDLKRRLEHPQARTILISVE